MISLILGHKGAGKTKHLISCVNEAVETSKGNVICVEKETKLTYDVNYRARLIATDDYEVLRIGGRDYNALAKFLEQVYELSEVHETAFVFTVSADKEELPESIFNFCKVL